MSLQALIKMVADEEGTEYVITHDSFGQHTLSWDTDITDPSGTVLAPGHVNLFSFPLLTFNRDGRPIEAVGEELAALEWIVNSSVEEPKRTAYRRDSSGGIITHALLIANTPQSLELCIQIFRRWPRLLPHAHGPGLFQGEHALHILAVNRRDDELCIVLEIAAKRLARYQYISLVGARCSGLFFQV